MCTGVISSDYDCSSDVIGKQTDGYHGSSFGLTQPVERVSCSDMTSPETDAEGIDCHLWQRVFNPEKNGSVQKVSCKHRSFVHSAYNQKLDVFIYSMAMTKWFEMARCLSAELYQNCFHSLIHLEVLVV